MVLVFWALVATHGCSSSSADAPRTPEESDRVQESLQSANGLRGVEEFADIQNEQERSAAIFAELGKVLTHPRCVNCHPSGDRPMQGDQSWPHQPLAQRGPDNHGAPGMECSTCHGAANFLLVPGRKDWHLAPIEMAWQGRSLTEICEQLKDPERNGHMSMDQLIDHMAHDDLVAYGWEPPLHLEPAPGSQALAGQLTEAWVETGAHCP